MSMNPDACRNKARRLFWRKHDRQEYTCPDCGRKEIQLASGLEVHHEDGDLQNHDMSNLVALCQPCHNFREGKKPSIRKMRHMRDQISTDDVATATNCVPICRDGRSYDARLKGFRNENRPALVVDMTKGDGYARVECDFVTAEGALVAIDGEGQARDAQPTLSSAAARSMNQMVSMYEDVNVKASAHHRTFTTSEDSNPAYVSFPPIAEEHAAAMASDLQPIVENPFSWTPANPPADGKVIINGCSWLGERFHGKDHSTY